MRSQSAMRVTKGPPKRDRAAYMRQWRARKRAAAKGGDLLGAAAVPISGRQRAKALCDWVEAELRVPEGPGVGERFRLMDWQREYFRGALDPAVREAGMSIGRRNGKSYSVALLCMGYLCGPLASAKHRAAAVSLTAPKSAILRDAIMGIAEASRSDAFGLQLRRTPYPGEITAAGGASILFLSADKAGAHGLGLNAAVVDEMGLMEERDRGLVSSLRQSLGGLDGQLIAMSVRGSSPLYEEMRERRHQPDVFWLEFAAPADCDLDDRDAWAAANPGLGRTKSLAYMERMARNAIDFPGEATDFRAFDLNQPQDPSREPIVDFADWSKCGGALPPRDGPCYAGLDLGGSTSQSAFVCYWPVTGRMECLVAFPASPNLRTRGRRDGVGDAWVHMAEAGELRTYAGRAMNVPAFIRDCASMLGDERPRAVAADRYRWAEMQDAVREARVGWTIVPRGTGMAKHADGSHDVRSFQRFVLSGALKHGDNAALRRAVGESEIIRDSGGNPKINKARQKARIDALAAAVLATGQAELHRAEWARHGEAEAEDAGPSVIQIG